jgi:hypothetical protein
MSRYTHGSKKGATLPLRIGRGDRDRDVDMSRSHNLDASEAVSDTSTTHAMLSTIMEQMSAFHNRLASLEAPPSAPSHAPSLHADELRHP